LPVAMKVMVPLPRTPPRPVPRFRCAPARPTGTASFRIAIAATRHPQESPRNSSRPPGATGRACTPITARMTYGDALSGRRDRHGPIEYCGGASSCGRGERLIKCLRSRRRPHDLNVMAGGNAGQHLAVDGCRFRQFPPCRGSSRLGCESFKAGRHGDHQAAEGPGRAGQKRVGGTLRKKDEIACLHGEALTVTFEDSRARNNVERFILDQMPVHRWCVARRMQNLHNGQPLLCLGAAGLDCDQCIRKPQGGPLLGSELVRPALQAGVRLSANRGQLLRRLPPSGG
jgi:hypothetical protein